MSSRSEQEIKPEQPRDDHGRFASHCPNLPPKQLRGNLVFDSGEYIAPQARPSV